MKRKGRIIKNILSLLLAPALVFTPVSGNIIGGGLSSSLTVSAAEAQTYGDDEYESTVIIRLPLQSTTAMMRM